MTGAVNNLAASAAGSPLTSAREAKRKEETERARRRLRAEQPREVLAPVDEVELTDAVRNLKDNTQEETHEDREEHPAYGTQPDGTPGRRIDLSA